MNIYLAAPYAARDDLKAGIVPALHKVGHEITSSWIFAEHEIHEGVLDAAPEQTTEYTTRQVQLDLADIDRSQIVLLFTGAFCMLHWELKKLETVSGGRHIETGYALALGKRIIILGQPENIFHRQLEQVDLFTQALLLLEEDYSKPI